MKKEYPCADCKLRRRYEKNPRSFLARLWHWHLRVCLGWKAYFRSLDKEEQEQLRAKYKIR